jgi:hypothetical protein
MILSLLLFEDIHPNYSETVCGRQQMTITGVNFVQAVCSGTAQVQSIPGTQKEIVRHFNKRVGNGAKQRAPDRKPRPNPGSFIRMKDR